MKYNFIYVFLFFYTILLIINSKKRKDKTRKDKENYTEQSIMSKGQTSNNGPWGSIGTDRPWYDYPYVLHNIEY
jgi:hypothetical protein